LVFHETSLFLTHLSVSPNRFYSAVSTFDGVSIWGLVVVTATVVMVTQVGWLQ